MPLRRKKSLVERATAKFEEMQKRVANARALAAERAKKPPFGPAKYDIDMERVKKLRAAYLARQKAANAERQKPNTPE